jgi:putative transposase
MRKTFKYRLYPSKADETKLKQALEACRYVYNQSIELKKTSYETEHKSLSLFDLNKKLTTWIKNKPELKQQAYSQVLQNCQTRVDLAYKAFFRRVKQGLKPGYPRFRGPDRYDSMTYKQSGFDLNPKDSTVYLSKIGRVPVILHRPCLGQIRTCTIQRTRTDKWFVSFSVETAKPDPLPKTSLIAGLDMGLKTFIVASDEFKIPRQRFFKTDEDALVKVQRRYSKFPKTERSPHKSRARKAVALVHERIKNRRDNFCHQTANILVHRYDFMAVEDLNINSMLEEKKYSKSIADAAWGQLLERLSCKAEEAGKTVVAVNPRGTSQMCSRCGRMVYKDLSVRIHDCSGCGLHIDRDLNASLNILRLGQQSVEYRAYATCGVGVV